MTPDPADCLLFKTGESVVCPDCDYEVAEFITDVSGDGWTAMREGRMEVVLRFGALGEGEAMDCPSCGAFTGAMNIGYPAGMQAFAVHIRSGSWTGWRELGGE